MLNDLLQKTRQHPKKRWIAFILLFVVIVSSTWGVVGLIGDMGFAVEISQYRWKIVLGTSALALVVTVALELRRCYREIAKLQEVAAIALPKEFVVTNIQDGEGRNVSIDLRQLFLEFKEELKCLIHPPFQPPHSEQPRFVPCGTSPFLSAAG